MNTQPWVLASVPYGIIWMYWAAEIMYCEAQAHKTRMRMEEQKRKNRPRSRRR